MIAIPQTDPNPYESPCDTREKRRLSLGPQPDSFFDSVRQGVRLGVKWVTYILGPVAILMLLFGIGMSAFRICFGEGTRMFTDPDLRWEMLEMLASPFGFYLLCRMWGIVGGLLVCPVVYTIRRLGTSAKDSTDS